MREFYIKLVIALVLCSALIFWRVNRIASIDSSQRGKIFTKAFVLGFIILFGFIFFTSFLDRTFIHKEDNNNILNSLLYSKEDIEAKKDSYTRLGDDNDKSGISCSFKTTLISSEGRLPSFSTLILLFSTLYFNLLHSFSIQIVR